MKEQEYIISIKGYEMVEKTAGKSGNSAYVYLPKKWAEKRVRIILLEPTDTE
jgi:putative transposon-encoded protein